MKKLMTLFTVAVALGVSTAGEAAEGYLRTTVTRTLIDDAAFGGCMAGIAASPATIGLDCPTNFVTFSCTGDFSSKDFAYRKFDSAQLAMVQGLSVVIGVDDSRRHNGHCYARRIDVLP